MDALALPMTSSKNEDDKKSVDLTENTRKRKRLSAVLHKLTNQIERRSADVMLDDEDIVTGTRFEDNVSTLKSLQPQVDASFRTQLNLDSGEKLTLNSDMPPASDEIIAQSTHPVPPCPNKSYWSNMSDKVEDTTEKERTETFLLGLARKVKKKVRTLEECNENKSLLATKESSSACNEDRKRQYLEQHFCPERKTDKNGEVYAKLVHSEKYQTISSRTFLRPNHPVRHHVPKAHDSSFRGKGNNLNIFPLLNGSFPTFPICSCHHCQTLAGQASGRYKHFPLNITWDELSKHRMITENQNVLSSISPVTAVSPVTCSLDGVIQSRFLPEYYRRRSHSDSDLHQWLEEDTHQEMEPDQSQSSVPSHIQRPVVRKISIRESSQAFSQESPLDLSVRCTSPRSLNKSGPFVSDAVKTPNVSLSIADYKQQQGDSRLSHCFTAFEIPHLVSGVSPESRNFFPVKREVGYTFGTHVSSVVAGSGTAQRGNPVIRYNLEVEGGSEVSYGCPICGQVFSLHDRLAKHMASRHRNRQTETSNNKSYVCEVCKRPFARSDMLTRHTRLHTGIKPYTCRVCGQVFSRSDHLSTHQRTHTGEKPYKCPQCPYAACRRDMITRHMRTHARYEIPDSSSSFDDISEPTRDKLSKEIDTVTSPDTEDIKTSSPTRKMTTLAVRSPVTSLKD
ncbi:uncharacterized protein LOC143247249 [Tachypleus tridentatus]|uniref:uncharacterized protein LOC143247249 n=1 Tax=Tachypleus tridentatus TaxID=6853 RepID=UPI003FD14712